MLAAAAWCFVALFYRESLAELAFLVTNIIGLVFVPIFMISGSHNRKRLVGLVILIVAWELLAFTLSDFFFPGQVRAKRVFLRSDEVYHGPWKDGFNDDLFQALNIIALALLLVLIGYRIFKGNEKSLDKDKL